MNMRYHAATETEHLYELRVAHQQMARPDHISPISCLIAVIGNAWELGCYEAVWAMMETYHAAGYEVTLDEEHDRCFQPYDALGAMRNNAYTKALAEGYEFIHMYGTQNDLWQAHGISLDHICNSILNDCRSVIVGEGH